MKKENIWFRRPGGEGSHAPRSTNRFTRWLDQFLSMDSPEYQESKTHAPPYDITETDSHYFMSLDLPGVARKDITVEVVGDELVITGDRVPRAEERSSFPSRGRPRYGKFKRSFTLPPTVDTEDIRAQCQDGVLTLSLPKRIAPRMRHVPILTENEPLVPRSS